MKFRIAILPVVALWLWAGPAAAQNAGLTPQQQQILQSVMAKDGDISKGAYDQFWAAMEVSGAKREDAVDIMRSALLADQAYARETWASTLLSLRSGQYTESEGYARAKQAALAAAQEYGTIDKVAPNIAKSERMMHAAAAHQPFDFGNGQSATLTEPMATSALYALDSALDRMKLLLQPTWQAPDRDVPLPELGLNLRFSWRLPRQVQKTVAPDGSEARDTSYSGSLDDQRYMSFAFEDYGTSKIDLAAAMSKMVNSTTTSAGLTQVAAPTSETWQGRDSMTVDATGTSNGTPIAEYVRVFHPRDRNGVALILVVVAGGSADDVAPAAKEVEQRLTVTQ